MCPIIIDVTNIQDSQIDELISYRAGAPSIKPQLVPTHRVTDDSKKQLSYNRFQALDKKEQFRRKLLMALETEWAKIYSPEVTAELIKLFVSYTETIDHDGGLIFGGLINKEIFQGLVNCYDKLLGENGSKSWIHSYLNLGNHPDFLSNKEFNQAFLHPLLIALIAHACGGAIRIVDARAKDAEPLEVRAQDNMLHIDNTPFRREFKIIVTWERGHASGPKGQNFVYLPGTHKGVRDCFYSEDKGYWSTEDASIFIQENTVEQAFEIQKKVLNTEHPLVVEVHNPDKPTTTVFEAGALVHHRYRTEEKNIPRSCIIVAFHRAEDNPGQLLSQKEDSSENKLFHLLSHKSTDNNDEGFITVLAKDCAAIANKILEINDEKNSAEIIKFESKVLNEIQFTAWKKTVVGAPTLEQLKINKNHYPIIGASVSNDEFFDIIVNKMMIFDKHGPLDLILYGDGHEEIRKWARNRIREMKPERLATRFEQYRNLLKQPEASDLMTPVQLANELENLLKFIKQLPINIKAQAQLASHEKISEIDAYRSLEQLISDLKEAIVRCDSRQSFLSTSLFAFWTYDELSLLHGDLPEELKQTGQKLLGNYVATGILITKQIQRDLVKVTNPDLLTEDQTQKSSAHLSQFFQNIRLQRRPTIAPSSNDQTMVSPDPDAINVPRSSI
ncbi:MULTISPECIES: hypothetical protein [Legionella]|nr:MULTISPECIES: hypothetical protein [Legionella]PJE12444.1 MAG: hypothetical protein CK430_07540 [Legionella sp.]